MVSLKESGSVLRDWSGQERPPRGETFKMMLKVERASLVAQRVERASLVAQRVKCLACNAGDLGSIPGSGRSPEERNGNPFQYPCLENPIDREAW